MNFRYDVRVGRIYVVDVLLEGCDVEVLIKEVGCVR